MPKSYPCPSATFGRWGSLRESPLWSTPGTALQRSQPSPTRTVRPMGQGEGTNGVRPPAGIRPDTDAETCGVGAGRVAENLSIDGPKSAIARLLGIIVNFSASTSPPRPSLITFPDYVRRIEQPSLGSMAIARLTVHGIPQRNRPTRPQARRPPPRRPGDKFARSGSPQSFPCRLCSGRRHTRSRLSCWMTEARTRMGMKSEGLLVPEAGWPTPVSGRGTAARPVVRFQGTPVNTECERHEAGREAVYPGPPDHGVRDPGLPGGGNDTRSDPRRLP
jgi:hypothetical protein